MLYPINSMIDNPKFHTYIVIIPEHNAVTPGIRDIYIFISDNGTLLYLQVAITREYNFIFPTKDTTWNVSTRLKISLLIEFIYNEQDSN